jgi:hypothetical protein
MIAKRRARLNNFNNLLNFSPISRQITLANFGVWVKWKWENSGRIHANFSSCRSFSAFAENIKNSENKS